MVILEKKIILSEAENCRHINVPFFVDKDGKILKIYFEYSPKELNDNRKGKEILIQNLKRYVPDKEYTDDELEKFLPLRNLITISIDSPKGCIGTAHRGQNRQKHIISENEASRGFCPSKIIKGEWNITLSCHLIVSESVEASLEVEFE